MENNLRELKPFQELTISPESEIDLFVLSRLLLNQRKLILSIMAATTLASTLTAFVLPRTYQAQATILPSGSSSTSATAGIAAQLGAAAGLMGGLSNGSSDDLVEVLSSRTIIDRVLKREHLESRIEAKTPQDRVKKLRKMVAIAGPSLTNKSIGIQVEARDPKLAAIVANACVVELKNMLDEMGYNSASKQRKFIENQLVLAKEQLEKAENALSSFQSKNQLAALPENITASIKSVSELEAQRVEAQVQLRSTEEAIQSIRGKSESLQADPNALSDLETKRRTLLAQQSALSEAKETFLSKLSKLPPQSMLYARLERDVQVQNAVYVALNQQYETAVINENKDSDAFFPLDSAEIPTEPSKPKKALIIAVGMIAGLLLGLVAAFLRACMNRTQGVAEC